MKTIMDYFAFLDSSSKRGLLLDDLMFASFRLSKLTFLVSMLFDDFDFIILFSC